MRRRLTATVAAWAVGFAVFRVGAVPAERCPDVALAQLRTGAVAAADWIERTQRPDGTYLYEYDRRTDQDVGGYNEVRHAGVTMSLFQLAAAGEPSVLPAADRGLAVMTANLLRVDGWAAYAPPGGDVKLGASALLLAGLSYRRDATGDHRYDDLMREIGGFFRALQLPSGSFLAYYDPNARRPIPGLTSLYSTGEAFFGYTLLANTFPGEGWDASARSAAHYIATDRDEDEGQRLGPWADQWSAYALDQMKAWPLTDEEVDYARRLAGRFGLFTRGESQKREDGVQHLIRLDLARGAGFGTVNEGVTSLWRLAGADARLADLREPLAERARCAAGITASRQVDAAEAARWPDPDRVLGAWFTDDRTRMDDQQHSLSGLVRTEAVFGAPDPFRGGVVSSLGVLAAFVAVVNPARALASVAPALLRTGRFVALVAAAVAAAVGVTLAALHESILDLLSVSAPTFRLGAGLVIAAMGLRALLVAPQPWTEGMAGGRLAALVPIAFPVLVTPELTVAAVSFGADEGTGIAAAGVVLALVLFAGLGSWPRLAEDRPQPVWLVPVGRLLGAAAVIVGVARTVSGVFDV